MIQLKSYTEEGLEIGNVYPVLTAESVLLNNGTLKEEFNRINIEKGNLLDLLTNNKNSIVLAINEIYENSK